MVINKLDRWVIETISRIMKLDVGVISSDSTLDQLGVDSLATAELLLIVEETFRIAVPDETALSMTTVSDVVDGLSELLAIAATGTA
jgi:acyl carrier protein